MSEEQIQGRPLYAHIDLNAFQHNIGCVESLCPEANALVVIKADAYGHGLLQMAQAAGKRDLAVASSNEARVLIQGGIKSRIWVLEGPLSEACMSLTQGHSVIWVVHSVWQLKLLARHASDVHMVVKVDTGMHRLGFMPEQLAEVLASVASMPHLHIYALMTHFASSDQVACQQTINQIAAFEDCLKQYALQDKVLSLANSGGILHYPVSRVGWVRPGIMLYGAMPDPKQDFSLFDLKPVMSLRSKVISLTAIRAGETVGYGGVWQAQRDSIIAVIACGYADGYPRHAVNGTPVWVAGKRVPLVGRVSMDMITVDVSDLPDVAIGDNVELWGEHISIDEVALSAGTIAYEILTQVTKRVPRIYSENQAE